MEEENPLFERCTEIMHVEEFDYYDAQMFYTDATIKRKCENYAIFGDSPYVLSVINSSTSIKENIKNFVLPETSILRIYIESVILKDIQKVYDMVIKMLGEEVFYDTYMQKSMI